MLPMIENVSLVTQVRQNCRRIKTRGAARVDWWQILAHGILRGHSPTCPPSVTAKINSKLFWELKTQLLQMLSVRCFWEAFLLKPAKNSSINYPLYGGKISDK